MSRRVHLHRAAGRGSGAALPDPGLKRAPRGPLCAFRSRFVVAVVAAAALLSGCLVGDPGPGSRWTGETPPPAMSTRIGLSDGPLPAHRFDLYGPERRGSDGRTIVFLHGGAWVAGDRVEVPGIVLALVRDGWNIASASYRLSCT